MNHLFASPSLADLLRLLRAWRFWLLGALLGGLLGAGWYNLFPPEYRARATVVVDFNAEQAWPGSPDNELFYYLDREARKLEEVAWADETLQIVADETGFTLSELRAVKLELSQPQDGGWHFYAIDADSLVAVKLASIWAKAFTAKTLTGIQTAVELEAARKALESNPDDDSLKEKITALEAQSLGITPELQISPTQVDELPVSRQTGLGTSVLAGAGIVLVLGIFLVLFIHPAVIRNP